MCMYVRLSVWRAISYFTKPYGVPVYILATALASATDRNNRYIILFFYFPSDKKKKGSLHRPELREI